MPSLSLLRGIASLLSALEKFSAHHDQPMCPPDHIRLGLGYFNMHDILYELLLVLIFSVYGWALTALLLLAAAR